MMDMEYQKTDACQQSACGQVRFFNFFLNSKNNFRENALLAKTLLISHANVMKDSAVQVVIDRCLSGSRIQERILR